MKHLNQVFSWAKLQPPIFRIRVAAGLQVKRNFIIATNSTRSHPFAKKYQKNQHAIHLHAETHCLVKTFQAGYDIKDLRDSTMYIARAILDPYTHEYRYGMCRPCVGCERALIDFEVGHVFFTTEKGIEQLW